MKTQLFVVPGSHPSPARRLMFSTRDHYRRVDLVPGDAQAVLPLLRFEGTTVPALEIDGRQLAGHARDRACARRATRPSRRCSRPTRTLAARSRTPSAGATRCSRAFRARLAWSGDQARLLGRAASSCDARLPLSHVASPSRRSAPIAGRREAASTARPTSGSAATSPSFRPQLDHVDALIATGVIGGAEPNAADFQIATSVALLMCFADLRPLIEGRPAAELKQKIVPEFPGAIPAVFPAEWLPAAR